MLNFGLIKEAMAAAKRGDFGDAALLEAASLRDPDPAMTKALAGLKACAPRVDMAELQRLPPGSFGRAYAEFITVNGIKPLEFSDAMLERFSDNPFIIRSTATHDMLHVLTGFDAGLPGEAGVYAFSVAQGTSTGGATTLWLLRIGYGLASPTQIRRVHVNAKIGLHIGAQAKRMIAEPLEDFFAEPLERVRERFDIPDPQTAGVLPSRDSFVAKIVFNKVLPPPVSPRALEGQ